MNKLIKILSAALSVIVMLTVNINAADEKKDYIKWIDFTVTSQALSDAATTDIKSHGNTNISWIQLLAVLAAKYGGNFSRYNKEDLNAAAERMAGGELPESICANKKLYAYYEKSYNAVLGGLLGKGTKIIKNESGTSSEEYYGVLAAPPLAAGYYYNHFDDFGASRSFGYKRKHLGHDLMGSLGTPVTAVEGGYVECLGWNRFGGWRIGIRSFDKKRYYYYAHLRKGHPFSEICEGDTVYAGQVIGYLGMTGYSSKSDVNNINVPHLHYGLQIIFNPSQKDGTNQIWISMYEITKFLQKYAVKTISDENGEKQSISYIIPDGFPD